jgi:zinc protease
VCHHPVRGIESIVKTAMSNFMKLFSASFSKPTIAIKNIAVRACLMCFVATIYSKVALAAIPIQHWTHANGAQVFLVASPAISMVDIKLDFDAGARRDPAQKTGLASVTAGLAQQGVLASGKLPALDENELGEAWADLGASFGGSASADRMGFSIRSLTYPDILGKAVALAARQLGEPSFPNDIWQRNRQRINAAIKEANTQPATLANRAFAKAVYGNHPYGNEVTEQSLANITVADMKALFASAIKPCRAVVSIVGAVTRPEADALVGELLSRSQPLQSMSALTSDCAPWAAVPEVAPLAAAKDERIPFDSAQAHVLIGQPGFKRNDPDFFALTVGNHILGGGGFVSRLTDEVREKRGLSYSVFSHFAPSLHAGAFTISLQTRPDQANQAIQVSREVLQKFVADGPSADELQAAKNNLIGGFALLIDTNAKLLGNVSNIAWNHLPLSYLDTWTQQVEKITVTDIKAAFERKLQPDKMVTVVVGGAP